MQVTSSCSPQQALQPSFTPRRSEGRDESASRMTVELCACACATNLSRGHVQRDVTANPTQTPTPGQFNTVPILVSV
jgi:hypothetical protein